MTDRFVEKREEKPRCIELSTAQLDDGC